MQNEYLATAYDEIDQRVAERLRTCATRLIYGIGEDGKRRLRAAYFCRVRLCPICQWRRSLKLYGQMSQAMRYVSSQGAYAYAFLTLTVRNVTLDGLPGALDQIYEGYRRLMQYREVKAAVRGWYRGIEITHNLDRNWPEFDTFHPHVHVVLVVKPSYFTSKYYLSQARWTELWKRATGIDYTPIVDVRKIKGDTAKAVAEATKYAAKSKDYIVLDDWDLTVETVRGLDKALHKRRLVGFGGLLAEARRKLALDDVDNGDLVRTDPDDDGNATDMYLESYAWHSGYCQYVRERD